MEEIGRILSAVAFRFQVRYCLTIVVCDLNEAKFRSRKHAKIISQYLIVQNDRMAATDKVSQLSIFGYGYRKFNVSQSTRKYASVSVSGFRFRSFATKRDNAFHSVRSHVELRNRDSASELHKTA